MEAAGLLRIVVLIWIVTRLSLDFLPALPCRTTNDALCSAVYSGKLHAANLDESTISS